MDEKIAKLYQNLKNEGVDDIRANDIIQKVKELVYAALGRGRPASSRRVLRRWVLPSNGND